jgi:hypothetical protein
MPAKKPPQTTGRKMIDSENVPVYLAELLEDFQLTTDIFQLWPKLEKILLATQRGVARITTNEGKSPDEVGRMCLATDQIINVFQMFAAQGKLDMEDIINK